MSATFHPARNCVRVLLTRSAIEVAAHGQPLLELQTLTVRLDKVADVGLLGRYCPRLRALRMNNNLLTTLHGARQQSNDQQY